MLKLALLRVAAATVMAAGLLIAMSPTSSAEDCPKLVESTGKWDYSCMDPGTNPTNPDPGGEGSSKPTCEYVDNFDEFCEGPNACWGNNPAANDEEAVKDKLPPKPDDPDANVAYKSCIRPDGSLYDAWYWSTPGDAVSLSELAQRAYGALEFPDFTPAFNPPTRTIVNLDTWWWAQGASEEELIGSSALGVRALATPSHMDVDPGDGSDVITCAFSTTKSDDCFHTYRRSSDRGTATAEDGSKAFPARVRLVWSVRFERNGNPLQVNGVPTSFHSAWQGVAVPVREVQTVVRPRN